jgi:hypothetical protein
MPRATLRSLEAAVVRILEYKAALIQRDPLYHQLEPVPFPAQLGLPADSPEISKAWRRYLAPRRELARKYHVSWVDVLRLDTGQTQLRIHAGAPQTTYTVNEGCFSTNLEEKLLNALGSRTTGHLIREVWCLGDDGPSMLRPGRHDRECYGTRGLSIDQAHTVTMTVDLSSVTIWNLQALANEFKALVRTALKLAPRPVQKGEPERLKFLATIQPEQFRTDLRRYDLRMKHGLSYRQTARAEGFRNKGLEIPKNTLKRKVGDEVRGEDAVEESVKRIYLAIHGRQFRQRKGYGRMTRDASAPGLPLPTFSCPTHGSDCPSVEDCTYLKTWMDAVEAELPSDQTGQVTKILTRTGEPYVTPRRESSRRRPTDPD